MIKIVTEKLNLGLDLLEITNTCPNSHNCLWLERPHLLLMLKKAPRGCPGEKCKVVVFREKLEEDAPGFYAEALNFSRYENVVKTKNTAPFIEIEKNVNDLHVFGELSALVLYPLYLEAGTIPNLKTSEIKKLRNSYQEAQIRQTIRRMKDINDDWLDWVRVILSNLRSTDGYYSLAVTYLVYLFLKGIELPDVINMSQSEKDEFFLEIEKNIFKK